MQKHWVRNCGWIVIISLLAAACGPVTIQLPEAKQASEAAAAAATPASAAPEAGSPTASPTGSGDVEEGAPSATEGVAGEEKPIFGIGNPASGFCEEQGGKLELRTFADGSQGGLCWFPDGSACEEWAFFRQECAPGGQWAPLSQEDCNAVAQAVEAAFGLPVLQGFRLLQADRPGMDQGLGCAAETTGSGRQLKWSPEALNARLVERMLALGFQASPPGSHRLADDRWSFTRRGDFCLLWLVQAESGQDQYTLILNCFQPLP